jgi:tetratricopeptide (TPR) repeat protein
VHLNLGIALADQHQADLALNEFSTAVQLAPNSAATHYNKGRLLTDLHRYSAAVPELQEACRLSPDLADAFFRLGLSERELKHYEKSEAAFERAMALDPRNADAYYLRGQSLNSLGKSGEAIALWKKAIEIDPTHSQALYSLFRNLAKTKPDEAKQYEARFQALQQQNGTTERAQTLNNFALAAAKSGNWPQAIAQLRQAIEVCGNCQSSSLLHKNLGLTQCQAGNYEDGEKELRLAQKAIPNDPDILRALQMLADIRNKPAQRAP